MLETIGKYTLMLGGALGLTLLSVWLKSDYLTNFFASNAILLGVTVFTIHAAAVGILISQLEILKQRTGGDFSGTIRGIRGSFKEAFAWLALTMIGAIILRGLESDACPLFSVPYIRNICSLTVLFAVIALLTIVLDTVNAILMCLGQPRD